MQGTNLADVLHNTNQALINEKNKAMPLHIKQIALGTGPNSKVGCFKTTINNNTDNTTVNKAIKQGVI